MALIIVCISLNMFAQLDVKTYYKNIEQGFEFYADNNEIIPISIKVTFKLKNLKSSAGNDKIFVVPAKTKNMKLTTLKAMEKGKYDVSSKTWYNHGNHFLTEYDVDFKYYLPFQKGESYKLFQGYNGTISHHNKRQLDFTMPIGTKIVAARGGLVTKVVDVNNRHCDTKECAKYNNLIYLYHDDGTFAEYLHIKRKGAKVKIGDKVKQGQVIADSGNVGWSTGPHLHFSVFLQRLNGEREFLKTKFKLDEGLKTDYLVEKENYIRNYD